MAAKKPKHRKRYSIVISTGIEKELSANHVDLLIPSWKSLQESLTKTLSSTFEKVNVSMEDCPDLSEYANLATVGICGSCRIAQVGGDAYLYDPKYQKKVTYELPDIVKACSMKKDFSLMIGSAIASNQIVGYSELIANTKMGGERHSRYCKIEKSVEQKSDKKEEKEAEIYGKAVLGFYPSQEIGCKGSLFLCDGLNDEPVICITVRKRINDKLSFTDCIQSALQNIKECGGNKQIGLGGVIKVVKGKIRASIGSGFVESKQNESNKYYSCGPNLVMFTTIMSGDPSEKENLHLSLQNTNFYSMDKHSNSGGVYHESSTDDIIEYNAYLSLAKSVYRIEDSVYNVQNKGN